MLLHRLATYDFTGQNEATVRDNWVIPLLNLLGYGGATLNVIQSELPVRLRRPTRMIGSKPLRIDYVPTVINRRLWILEAKAAAPDSDWADHLEQAWGYATHPDIDVPLMA